MMRALSFLLLAACTTACGLLDGNGSSGSIDVQVTTDSARYVLHDAPGQRQIELHVTLENRGTRRVYLHRACGYGDKPSASLLRVDDSRVQINDFVIGIACKNKPYRPPLALRAGESHVHTIRLSTTESPFARYPTLGDTSEVSYRVEYDIQRSDEGRGWEPVDLIEASQRISNDFTVVVPRVR